MSELSTLYARVHISKENLDAFLNAQPSNPKQYTDWSQWFHDQGISEDDRTSEFLFPIMFQDMKSLIAYFQEDPGNICFSDYDDVEGCWHLLILFFSENYGQMIPGLSALRDVAKYCPGNTDDFVIVFDYWWGDTSMTERLTSQVNALLVFENQTTLFRQKSTPTINAHIIDSFSKYQDRIDACM